MVVLIVTSRVLPHPALENNELNTSLPVASHGLLMSVRQHAPGAYIARSMDKRRTDGGYGITYNPTALARAHPRHSNEQSAAAVSPEVSE